MMFFQDLSYCKLTSGVVSIRLCLDAEKVQERKRNGKFELNEQRFRSPTRPANLWGS